MMQDEGDLPSGQGIRQSAVPVSSPTAAGAMMDMRSEEHTSELQSP